MKNQLDLGVAEWRRISDRQILLDFISNILSSLFVLAPLVAAAIFWQPYGWWLLGVGIFFVILNLFFVPRRVRAVGYQLREDDFVFRKGIAFLRSVAVPYGRLQLVDITRGPLERARGLATLKLVTAAISTSVDISGLPIDEATALRDELIQFAESRRAGL